jgi:hypothetical protein
MSKKKIIGTTIIASAMLLGVKGVRDITLKSDVNLSTQWMFGEPNEIQMTFARNGQAYQDEMRSIGTIETVLAGVLLTTGIVCIK